MPTDSPATCTPKRIRFPTDALRKRDQRTREARLERRIRSALVERVGGHPTPAQLDDIQAATRLAMRLAVMDADFVRTGTQSEVDSENFVRLTNAHQRVLERLQPATKPRQTLNEYLAEAAARRTAEAAP